jgi:hypothetical protein
MAFPLLHLKCFGSIIAGLGFLVIIQEPPAWEAIPRHIDPLEVIRMVRKPPRKRSPRKGLQVRLLSLPNFFQNAHFAK